MQDLYFEISVHIYKFEFPPSWGSQGKTCFIIPIIPKIAHVQTIHEGGMMKKGTI